MLPVGILIFIIKLFPLQHIFINLDRISGSGLWGKILLFQVVFGYHLENQYLLRGNFQ